MAAKTHSEAYKFALEFYPKRWNKDRLKKLVEKGLLYDWEYQEIVGEPYKK